jgi:hypothetical protein
MLEPRIGSRQLTHLTVAAVDNGRIKSGSKLSGYRHDPEVPKHLVHSCLAVGAGNTVLNGEPPPALQKPVFTLLIDEGAEDGSCGLSRQLGSRAKGIRMER